MKTIEAVQCKHCRKLHPKENVYDYVIVSFNVVREIGKIIFAVQNEVYCNQCLAKAISKALDLYDEY